MFFLRALCLCVFSLSRSFVVAFLRFCVFLRVWCFLRFVILRFEMSFEPRNHKGRWTDVFFSRFFFSVFSAYFWHCTCRGRHVVTSTCATAVVYAVVDALFFHQTSKLKPGTPLPPSPPPSFFHPYLMSGVRRDDFARTRHGPSHGRGVGDGVQHQVASVVRAALQHR